jgi:hypothetical protein
VPSAGGWPGGTPGTLLGGAPAANAPGSATGLTATQEQSLLRYLLGGG